MQSRSLMQFFCPLGFVWPVAPLKSQQCCPGTAKGQAHAGSIQPRTALLSLLSLNLIIPWPGLHFAAVLVFLELISDKPGPTSACHAQHAVTMRSCVCCCVWEQELSALPCPGKTQHSLLGAGHRPKLLLGNKPKAEAFTWLGFENFAVQQFWIVAVKKHQLLRLDRGLFGRFLTISPES